MISPQTTALVVIDVQDNLMPVIHDNDAVAEQIATLVQGANILEVPVVVTEQYPERLGQTISGVASHLSSTAITKLSFSCCGVGDFNIALETLGRKNILVVGVETHVCVLQTVLDLIGQGYAPYVVADAVSSRRQENKDLALSRMAAAGAIIVSVEMALFELLGRAEGDAFKKVLKLVK